MYIILEDHDLPNPKKLEEIAKWMDKILVHRKVTEPQKDLRKWAEVLRGILGDRMPIQPVAGAPQGREKEISVKLFQLLQVLSLRKTRVAEAIERVFLAIRRDGQDPLNISDEEFLKRVEKYIRDTKSPCGHCDGLGEYPPGSNRVCPCCAGAKEF